MIDRIGKSTYGFTDEAKLILTTAASKNPDHLLDPHDIAYSLVDHFKDAFGDISTQQSLKSAFMLWRSDMPNTIEDIQRFMEEARSRASRERRQVISGLDLLSAAAAPDTSTLVEPLSFFTGDQRSPLVYREAVCKRAGAVMERHYYGSAAHSVIELSERFTVIPPGLLDRLNLPEPDTPYRPEGEFNRMMSGTILEIPSRRTNGPAKRYVLA